MKKAFEIENTAIDFGTCTLEEFNRELKRLSSGKCRLGWVVDSKGKKTELNSLGKKIEAKMQTLDKIKAERFGTTTSGKWLNLSKAEIEKLSLEELQKGIASIASKLSRYGASDEVLELEVVYKATRDRKKKEAEFERLKAELEA